MANLLHDDGCVRASIETRPFEVTFRAVCEHGRMRQATFILDAVSSTDAAAYAQLFLTPPRMTFVSVVPLPEGARP